MDCLPIDKSARYAGANVAAYLKVAIAEIDAVLGDGYAAKNPVLLAGFIQAMAVDREVSGVKQAIEVGC